MVSNVYDNSANIKVIKKIEILNVTFYNYQTELKIPVSKLHYSRTTELKLTRSFIFFYFISLLNEYSEMISRFSLIYIISMVLYTTLSLMRVVSYIYWRMITIGTLHLQMQH